MSRSRNQERKVFWTYAAGADGIPTFRPHLTQDEAEAHYSAMRFIGGPIRIGLCRKRRSKQQLFRELQEKEDQLPRGFVVRD